MTLYLKKESNDISMPFIQRCTIPFYLKQPLDNNGNLNDKYIANHILELALIIGTLKIIVKALALIYD